MMTKGLDIYIVISSCDDRYDFNLEISTTSKIDFLNHYNCFINDMECEERDNGVIVYRKSKRVSYNDEIDSVSFMFFMLIPIDLALSNTLYIEDGIVQRNRKFGFLDTKL